MTSEINFLAPKRPSKVEWDQDLYTDEYIHHTPPSKISQPRPILQQV